MSFEAFVSLKNMKKGNQTQLTLPTTTEELEDAFKMVGLDYDEAEPGDYGLRIINVCASYLSKDDIETIDYDTGTDIDDLDGLCLDIDLLRDDEMKCLAAYVYAYGKIDDIEDLDRVFHNIYDGYIMFYPDMTLTELAEELVNEGAFGEIPDRISSYINYEAIGRDLGYDNYVETYWGVILMN